MITRRGLIVGSTALMAAPALARSVIMDFNGLFPQTKAIIAAFTTPPTSAIISAINTTVGLITRANVWPDKLYVTAAADAQSKTIDWVTPAGSNSLVQVGSVAFVPFRGVTSDGTTGYFTTGYTPSSAGGLFAQDSAHVGAWITNNTGTAGQELTVNAADFSQPTAQFNARTTGNVLRGGVNDTTAVNLSSVANSSGHSGISRIGTSTSFGFKNGASVGPADTNASTGVAAGNLYICGTPMYGLSTKQVAAAHIGGGFSATQIASLYAALLSYMHAVGVA